MRKVNPIVTILCVIFFVLVGCGPSLETVEHTSDQALLAKIALETKDADVRRAVVDKLIRQQSAFTYSQSLFEVASKLKDKELLGRIALEANDALIRQEAVKKFSYHDDQEFLKKIVKEDSSEKVRAVALSRITDCEFKIQRLVEEPSYELRRDSVEVLLYAS
jgi:hypothetical protein